MFKSYLLSAFRNILKDKLFSFITILGLTGGLTSSLLIFTFVNDELNYDNFHDNGDRIYRVQYFIQNFNLGRVPPVFAENIATYFPEVETTSHLFSRSVSIQVKDDGTEEIARFEEPNVSFADSSIFEIFNFELVSGSLEGALTRPFTVVLNSELAVKYFKDQNPIGKTILMEGSNAFQVVAVVEDFPSNSHVHFDMLVPYENMYDLEPATLREAIRTNFQQNWMVSHSPTYVLLKEGADVKKVNTRFADFVKEKIPEAQQKEQSFLLQPLADIHLNDEVMAQSEPSGSLRLIYIFVAIGLLTLGIACINFVNLSTARSLKRAKEIGVRKVLGAWKSSLIVQFLGESFVTTAIATICSLGLTIALLPQMNLLTNKNLMSDVVFSPTILTGLMLLFVITSFLAGLYPSFYVTRFSPLSGLKGEVSKSQNGGLQFRKGLIVIQFTISMILISGTLIVFDQLNMMRTRPLGFKKDLMVTFPLQGQNFNSVFGGVDASKRQKMNAFEEAITQLPSVQASTVSSIVPGFGAVNRNVIPEGYTAEDNVLSPVMSVDYDFLGTYEIALVAGRGFSKEYGTDQEDAFLINEFGVSEFKFGSPEEALGKTINMEGKEGRIVGVVKDFNFLSLSQPMSPLLLEVNVAQFSTFTVKIDNHNIPETLSNIEHLWNDFFKEDTFDATFLDESIEQSYNQQEQLGKVVSYFSILAIIISCLGSYGLIMFIASQKMKEVGIRKVLGASAQSIVLLLSRRFVLLVLLAVVISVPITYWIASDWLNQFSYSVTITPVTFILASGLTLILVILTIAFQAIKAAVSNPVRALRAE